MTPSRSAKNTIVVQQLLFGYDRGHGLLASSDNVARKLAQTILSDTDWDPRISAKANAYLSARPIIGEKCYAVMKTWQAPEMPRPGCVWTHALVLANADLSRIPDLTTLGAYLCRPVLDDGFTGFQTELKIDLTAKGTPTAQFKKQLVSNLVRRTYSEIQQDLPQGMQEDIDLCFLGLWSQQWPSLRRKFSFRTGPLEETKSSSSSSFDLELKRSSGTPEGREDVWLRNSLQLIENDIVSNTQSKLRKFLWRYGSDTNGDRYQLLWLTHLYQQLQSAVENPSKLNDIFREISRLFPRLEDANLLKSELAKPLETSFSLLPKFDQFEIVRSIRSNSNQSAFPELGFVERKTVNDWIKSRPVEIGKLLQEVADSTDTFACSLFDGIAPKKHKEFLWQLMPNLEQAFLRSSETSISHLVDDRVASISDKNLLLLLKHQTNQDGDIERLIPYLLSRSSTDLISLVIGVVPEAVTASVIDSVSRVNNRSDQRVHPHWIEYVKDNPALIMDFGHKTVKSKSQLLVCRHFLNANNGKTPLSIWSKRLDVIDYDLSGTTDLEFSVFLLIQALNSPEKNSRTIFQHTFDTVHKALALNLLEFQTEMQLSDYLPSIGWLNNWDKCFRLRVAVAEAYKQAGFSKKQLLKVTYDQCLKGELSNIWSN